MQGPCVEMLNQQKPASSSYTLSVVCVLQVFGVRPSAGGTEAAAHYSLQQRLQVVRSFNAANAARSLQVSPDAVLAGLDPFQVLTSTPLSKSMAIIEQFGITSSQRCVQGSHLVQCV